MQEVRFFFFRFLIISCKKLYRKQPVGFLKTEHIILPKSDLSFLKSSFLKAGLYCTGKVLTKYETGKKLFSEFETLIQILDLRMYRNDTDLYGQTSIKLYVNLNSSIRNGYVDIVKRGGTYLVQ